MNMDRGEQRIGFSLSLGRALTMALCLAVAITLGAGAVAQTTQQDEEQSQSQAETPDLNRVVARVDGEEITLGEVAYVYQSLGQRVQNVPFQQIYPRLLDEVISQRLLAQAAREQELDDTFEHRLRMRMFEQQALQDAYLRNIYENEITEELMRQRYEALVESYEGPEELRSSHILVATEEEARSLIQQLQGGADFAELAREHSMDPSNDRGGDLGYLTRDEMVAPYAEAAFGLETGQVTNEPVQSQAGWHVIKLTDRRRRPAPPFDEVRRQVRVQVAQQIAEERVNAMLEQAQVERFNLDGTPLQEGQQNQEGSE